jgi:hypothetical protein
MADTTMPRGVRSTFFAAVILSASLCDRSWLRGAPRLAWRSTRLSARGGCHQHAVRCLLLSEQHVPSIWEIYLAFGAAGRTLLIGFFSGSYWPEPRRRSWLTMIAVELSASGSVRDRSLAATC